MVTVMVMVMRRRAAYQRGTYVDPSGTRLKSGVAGPVTGWLAGANGKPCAEEPVGKATVS